MKTLQTILIVLIMYFLSAILRSQEIIDALKANDLDKVKMVVEKDTSLLSLKDQAGRTPFHWTAANGSIEIAEYLFNEGSTINNRNALQSRPLHAATSVNNVVMAAWLIEHDAKINLKNSMGWIPLIWASRVGRKELVELFLNKGADATLTDKAGLMPINVALVEGNKETLDFLLDKNATINMTGENGLDVLQIARGILLELNSQNTNVITIPKKLEKNKSQQVITSHRLTEKDVERLLVKPACSKTILQGEKWSRIQNFPVQTKGITLSAELYLPEGEGPWPAVIIVPGGFNETELIMESSRYEAPRLAQCGFAAVIYYKRGTGLSGGCYADATYDDFIDDVGSIAIQLSQHSDIDKARIGASGGSGGGFVASIAAARYPQITFVVNKSGPIVPQDEEDNFNISYALRSRGYADSLVEQVLPLWKRHHAAWAQADTAELKSVAVEIKAKREQYDPFMLPTPYTEVFTDSNLVFLWPKFRSASRDYLSELKTMRKKWLSIYGEKDPIVPVTSCIQNIEALMKKSENDEYSIIVLPDVDHSFINHDTRRQVPTIRIVVNWLNENVRKK